MFRSFPRTRESRAQHAGPSLLPWVPAFAGTSGIDVDSILPEHALALFPPPRGRKSEQRLERRRERDIEPARERAAVRREDAHGQSEIVRRAPDAGKAAGGREAMLQGRRIEAFGAGPEREQHS